MNLAELFPEGDYRFHLTLRRSEPKDFFTARDASGAMLRERARWLDADPARYATLHPEGEPLLREFAAWVAGWQSRSSEDGDAASVLLDLGRQLEPDFLFLSPDESGQFRLRGGVLCFPTGWALGEKIGHPLDFIHGVVPGLNPSLGASIHQFLTRLKPGTAFLRDNWGLAANDELNHHPSRHHASPAPPVALEKLWLRVEHQALFSLPETRGVVFAIRIALHRLDTLARDPAIPAFKRALASMPLELAAYKRIDAIRPHLLNVL